MGPWAWFRYILPRRAAVECTTLGPRKLLSICRSRLVAQLALSRLQNPLFLQYASWSVGGGPFIVLRSRGISQIKSTVVDLIWCRWSALSYTIQIAGHSGTGAAPMAHNINYRQNLKRSKFIGYIPVFSRS